LDVSSFDIHDGESLLPVGSPARVRGLSEVHEVSYLNSMQNTP
jgi:hypothetical protein